MSRLGRDRMVVRYIISVYHH